jgi:hypothetical protein
MRKKKSFSSRRKFLFASVGVILVFLLPGLFRHAFLHARETRIEVGEGLIEDIKFIAGADNQWFTPDDAVYTYTTLLYDQKGRFRYKNLYVTGPDQLPHTADDQLKSYQRYEYDTHNKPIV